MGEADLWIAHLALVGGAAQLEHRLHDLAHAGGAHRMALTLEAAAGVYGDPSVQRGLPGLGTGTALARPEEAHVLRGDDLSDSEAVVHLREADVPRSDTRHLVGPLRCLAGGDK